MLTELKSFVALKSHFDAIKDIRMRDMFQQDPVRAEKMTLHLKDFILDYSKNRITDETVPLLVNLANECNLEQMRDKMFDGDAINFTEKRSVLHIALRNRANRPIFVDGKDIMPNVNAVLEKMHVFSDKVRSGEWKGATGERITDVVNIGSRRPSPWRCISVRARKSCREGRRCRPLRTRRR